MNGADFGIAGDVGADEHITLDLRFDHQSQPLTTKLTVTQRHSLHTFERRASHTPRIRPPFTLS